MKKSIAALLMILVLVLITVLPVGAVPLTSETAADDRAATAVSRDTESSSPTEETATEVLPPEGEETVSPADPGEGSVTTEESDETGAAEEPGAADEPDAAGKADTPSEPGTAGTEDEEPAFPFNADDAGIAEGWYRIESALDSAMVLDMTDGSTAARAYFQLYKNNGTEAQVFYVKKIGEGRYTIMNQKSALFMNCAHGGTTAGTRLWQYRDDGTEAMVFNLTDAGSGYCTILSAKSGLAVDVKNAQAVKKAEIRLWRANGTPAQMWRFVPAAEPDANLPSGYYTLKTLNGSGKALDVDTAGLDDNVNVRVHRANGTPAQVFYIDNKGDGLYTIMASHSGKLLTPSDSRIADGVNIVQRAPDTTGSQLWRITKAGDQLCIRAAEAAVCLAVDETSADGVNVRLETITSNSDQRWLAAAAAEPSVVPVNGLYTISVAGSAKVLDVAGGSVSNANIQIYKKNDTDAQKFLLISNGDGTFTITNIKSYLALDVTGASSADGTNVTQHLANINSNAQVWRISGCPGRYRITSACGGKVLTVAGNSITDRANVTISTDKGLSGQRFTLTPAMTDNAVIDKGVYRLVSAKNTSLAVDVPNADYAEGLVMRMHRSNYTDAQMWQFIGLGDGTYVIMNARTGLCLTAKAYGGSSWGASKGTTVIQYNEIESQLYKQYQTWLPVPAGDGGFYLKNPATGLYLDVKGGSTENDTPLQVYTGNGTEAQKFYVNRVQCSAYLRWHDYGVDSLGRTHWLEGTFWDDPQVSDTEFLAAAIYTEGGSQGLAGMMLIGYSMLNRSSLKDIRYAIYEYGQYEICRTGTLTKILTAIKTGNTAAYSKLPAAVEAAKKCVAGENVTLTDNAVLTYPGGSRSLSPGTVLKRTDLVWYDGFMTPAAFARHGFTTANNHTISYLGHIYYKTEEIW